MPLHLFIAHAFGQVYNLPVPLWLYLYTGAAAIVLSFLVVSYFVEAKPAAPRGFTLPGQFTGLIATLRAVSLLLFALILVCGLFGVQLPLNNFATTFFWVIFYLGATYLAAVFGNLWDFVNPLKVVVRGVEKITHTTFEPRLPYPRWLGYWPAFAFYFGFIWLELLSAGFGIVPLNIASLLMMYTLVTLCGSVVFGRERWFDQAETPTIFLRLVARLAPFHWDKGRVQLRPPLVGLLDNTPKPLSLMVFVVFMLASTAFDGLKETKAFAAIYNQLATLPGLGHLPYQALATLILALAPLLFLAAYWLCMIAIVPITAPTFVHPSSPPGLPSLWCPLPLPTTPRTTSRSCSSKASPSFGSLPTPSAAAGTYFTPPATPPTSVSSARPPSGTPRLRSLFWGTSRPSTSLTAWRSRSSRPPNRPCSANTPCSRSWLPTP
jgi:hypothetical protein